MVQDAFLGHGTKSPYLAILNHIGVRSDEDASKVVPPEVIEMVGPDSTVRRLQRELDDLESTLRGRYSRASRALPDEYRGFKDKQNQLRTARQKQRRKIFNMIYRDHFDAKDEEEFEGGALGPVAICLAQRPKLIKFLLSNPIFRRHFETDQKAIQLCCYAMLQNAMPSVYAKFQTRRAHVIQQFLHHLLQEPLKLVRGDICVSRILRAVADLPDPNVLAFAERHSFFIDHGFVHDSFDNLKNALVDRFWEAPHPSGPVAFDGTW